MSSSSPHLDATTIKSAVTALTKLIRSAAASRPPQLLADESDDLILLQLSLHRIPSSSRLKPHLLPLPHPFHSATSSICLFADDRSNPKSSSSPPTPSTILEIAKSNNLPISEVITISTLRTDYRPFESRRKLDASHDLFLADRCIIPLLPRLVGKSFFVKKKTPTPIDMSRAGWPEQVKRVMGSTCFYLRSGTCCGVKVGRLDMEVEEIAENVVRAVELAVELLPKKWEDVRSIHLKAVDTIALPIYQAVPKNGLRIPVPERKDVRDGEVLDVQEEESSKKEKKKKKKKTAAIRYIDNEEVVGDEEIVVREKGEKRKKKNVMEADLESVKDKKRRKEGEVESEKKIKKRASKHVVEVEGKKDKEKKRRKKDDGDGDGEGGEELVVEKNSAKKEKKHAGSFIGFNDWEEEEKAPAGVEKKKSKAEKLESGGKMKKSRKLRV